MAATPREMEGFVQCCAPLVAPALTQEEADTTAAVLRALSDPARVRIVNLLANAARPTCVCEITAAIGLSQPTVSFHLKKLVASGLLTRRRRGVWAYYHLNKAALEGLGRIFADVRGDGDE